MMDKVPDHDPEGATEPQATQATEDHPIDAVVRLGRDTIDPVADTSKIETWLSALLQADHVSLLLGSGYSIGVANLCDVPPASMEPSASEATKHLVAAADRSAARLKCTRNVEDVIRVATQEWLFHTDHGNTDDAAPAKARLDTLIGDFVGQVSSMEAGIGTAFRNNSNGGAGDAIRTFFGAFVHRPASKDRLHVFTTNYDRLIEHAFDHLGVHVVDRFVGALNPRFRSSRLDLDLHYSPPGLRGEPRYLEGVVRLTKLHGSLDWRFGTDGSIERIALPLGGKVENADASLVVYPNDAKDLDTAQYPYTDLFRDFAATLCRPNHVLVTYGYGFRDSHINRVIADMLTIPSTHLVAVSYDDKEGVIRDFVDEYGLAAQTTTIIGADIAALDEIVKRLPAPGQQRIETRALRLAAERNTTPEQTAQT